MIEVYRADFTTDDFISRSCHIDVAPSPDILVLSLAWVTDSNHSIVVSLSNGAIAIADTKSLTSKIVSYQAHSLEAWVIAWSKRVNHPAVYSGGDDSTICCHRLTNDVEADKTFDAPLQPTLHGEVVRDRKVHGAGVTSILVLWSENDDHEYLLTGSYDEFVRLLKVTTGNKRPEVLVEKRLGGGVWQLRQIEVLTFPSTGQTRNASFTVVASCMHAGCRVLQIHKMGNGDCTIEVLAKFEEHESMNYASDATILGSSGVTPKDLTFVSTSFYDKKLCVWRLSEA